VAASAHLESGGAAAATSDAAEPPVAPAPDEAPVAGSTTQGTAAALEQAPAGENAAQSTASIQVPEGPQMAALAATAPAPGAEAAVIQPPAPAAARAPAEHSAPSATTESAAAQADAQEPAGAEPAVAESVAAAPTRPSRAQGGAPTVENQLKAKFAEVVARKEAPPPADSKDRIAAIFRKVQSDSTRRSAPEPRAQSSSDATERIASIMRKGLHTGPAVAASRPNAKPDAAPAGQPEEIATAAATAAAAQGAAATRADAGATAHVQAPGKVAIRIVELLKSEIDAGGDANQVALLTAIGALAGYAAQRAVWEGVVLPGALNVADAFRVIKSPSGESFYFGAETDKLIGSLDPRYLSIWKIVTGNTKAATGEHPEMVELFEHCAASAGTPEFGIPRLPDERKPDLMPRDAVNRLWAKARLLLARTEPTLWPMHMAVAARSLILAAQPAVPVALGIRIVMEAAVPMSRIDPATVPRK
jgi:hypothetical protein